MSYNIIWFLTCIIYVFTYAYAFLKIKNKKLKNRCSFIIITLIYGILFFICNILFSLTIKCYVSIFLLISYYYLSIEKDINNALVNVLLIYIINNIVDMINYFILNYIKQNYSVLFSDYNYIMGIFCTLIFAIFIVIIFKVKIFSNILKNLSLKFEKIFNQNIYPIVYFLMIVIINIISYKLFTDNFSSMYIILLFVPLLASFFAFSKLLYAKQEMDLKNHYLLLLNNFYSNQLEEDKMYKHNIKNKFIAIKNIGNKKTKELINEYLNIKEGNLIVSDALYKVPNSLKGIFSSKLYNIKKIKLIINNELDNLSFANLKMSDYRKLCEFIGVSLDNAIEAAANVRNGFIYITFLKNINYYEIQIHNNFKGNLDFEKMGKKKYSTKNRESGYGLLSIKKSKAIETKYKIKNDEFIVFIILKKIQE